MDFQVGLPLPAYGSGYLPSKPISEQQSADFYQPFDSTVPCVSDKIGQQLVYNHNLQFENTSLSRFLWC